MKIKLHWKLTFVFCSAIIVGLLVGYFYLTAHLKTYLDSHIENNLRREVALVQDFFETRLKDQSDLSNVHALAHRVGKELELRVTVVTADGVVIGDSDLDPDQLKQAGNHLDRVEVQEAIHKGFGLSKRYSYTLKKYLLYAAVPFGKDKALGVVRLAMPLSEVELFEAQSQKIVFFSLVFTFLLSLGFTFLISLYVSKPLKEMSEIARAMAGGDFSRKPSISSKDEVGDLAWAITHLSDEIKNKIEKIKLESAKLDAVLTSMFEGIMVVDEKGTILVMNPSIRKLFLIDMAPEGKRSAEVIRNSAVVDIVERLLQAKQRLISEDVILNAPEERAFKVNGAAILRDQKLEGAVLVFHDITELRRLEKVRQDFVANVSHELRTPISSIKGYAETLLGGAMNDKKDLKEFLEVIHQNSDRLASLINDLLDLAKIESGKMSMAFVPLEIHPIINRCLGILEKQVQEKSLAVSVEMTESLPKVMGDETRLSQVFLNLLDNAVKYTPEKGSVRVSAVIGEKSLQINVSDTGMGIPEKDLPRIFERFYRVDKARSREIGGTGLGLSIVKHIVHAHGGEVLVKSELGRGTTFSITIPLA